MILTVLKTAFQKVQLEQTIHLSKLFTFKIYELNNSRCDILEVLLLKIEINIKKII